jgi:adenylate cyclase
MEDTNEAIGLPHLIITSAEGQQRTLLLDRGTTWRMGRGEDGKIVLADNAASRRHAVIQRSEMGEYYLLDLGSRNGTFVQGQRVRTPLLLKHGDEISVGAHKLVFLDPPRPDAGQFTLLADEQVMTGTRVMFAERLVTVLVVDIHGFTQLTQQIRQETLCKFINLWFSDASGIFRAHGSWALKYIGDAVMAAWLHESMEDKRPVLSALAALEEFAGVSSAARYSLPVPLSFGAGLNTGMASIGNAGTGDQTDFTAFGEVVNAAFRIEAGTRRIGTDFAIGRHAVSLLGGDTRVNMHLREHSLELKGYEKPVPVWAGTFEDVRALSQSCRS